MLVKQISVFLENKSGRLAEVSRVLGRNNINISALSIADTTDFGILRLIVNNPGLAEKVLAENGFAVGLTDVIAVAIEDRPGGLCDTLNVLESANIDIEYMYAFVGKSENEAMVIIRVEDPEKAARLLIENNIKVLPSENVYSL